MVQKCEHLVPDSAGAIWALPGGVTAELCTECVHELRGRLDTEQREETPIEAYARERTISMQCQWKSGGTAPVITCKTLAQTGSSMCPRHTFLTNIKLEEDRVRELSKLQKKQQNQVQENTRIGLLKRGYEFKGSANCKGCGLHIEWWKTPKGFNAPYDPMPDENSKAVSHHATCKNPAAWRRTA